MDVRGVWVVYVWSHHGGREELLDWLREHGSFESKSPSSMERVLAVESSELPRPWERLFGRFDVPALVLREEGSAVLSLRGSRAEIGLLLDELGDAIEVEQVIDVPVDEDASRGDPLTRKEREALLSAYEAGYFAVPRRIRLSELADEMGKSTGGLSTLLRRGVQRLVAAYARENLEDTLPPEALHETAAGDELEGPSRDED